MPETDSPPDVPRSPITPADPGSPAGSSATGQRDTYIHGHHDSVLRSHRWRDARNSAAYLLEKLNPGDRLLDVGCGPGTITVDLASLVEGISVTGIDSEPGIVESARGHASERHVENVHFEVGDVYNLSYEDDSFDVVHAHQVMQHLTDPVSALSEMKRVTRKGGLVAARDGDYGSMGWFPYLPELDEWRELYFKVARANHGEPDGGRHLPSWARSAGFTDIHVDASIWCFAGEQERLWWGDIWAERATKSTFAEQALARGLADQSKLERISDAWRRWSHHEDAIFLIPNVEIICTA